MAISTAVPVEARRVRARSIGVAIRGEQVVDMLAAAVVLAVFALQVVPQAGGRDGTALELGLVTTTAGFVVTRSWRFLRPGVLLLLSSMPAAALLVSVLTPSAGAGFRDAATYAYAAVTFAFVAALARTPARRNTLFVAVCALGLDQFRRAFLPWWGGEDPGRMMLGSFYWHNQFAAYMLGLALAAGVVGIFGAGALRLVGLMIAPVLGAAVLLSGSRGGLLLLAFGWLVVGAAGAIQRTGRMRALFRWALIACAVVIVSTALTSSVFFPSAGSGSGLGAVERRNNSQTAGANLAFRVAHDKAAIAVFLEHSVSGAGFQSYAAAASRHLPFGLRRSPYVHNGYLQAAADGGLLLLVPLLMALMAGVVALARSIFSVARSISSTPTEMAGAVAAMALLAHSAIDVDWTYPALVALLATLLATALSTQCCRPLEMRATLAWRRRASAVVLPCLVIAAISALVRWDHVQRLVGSGVRGKSPDIAVRLLLREDARLIPDARLQSRALAIAVPEDFSGHVNVSRDTARAALLRSARLGSGDAVVQMQRAQLFVALGEGDEGVRLARRVVVREAAARPFLLGEYAETLAAVGRGQQATDVLLTALADVRLGHVSPADQLAMLTSTLARLAGPNPPPATSCVLWVARTQIAAADLSQRAVSPDRSSRPAECAGQAGTPTAPAVDGR